MKKPSSWPIISPAAPARQMVQDASAAGDADVLTGRIAELLGDRPDLQRAWVQRKPAVAQPKLDTVFERLRPLRAQSSGE